MTRALEITLKSHFREFTRFYFEAFPRAYFAQGGSPVDFGANLALYELTITTNCDAIYRVAAAGINSYLNLYNIHANQSPDELKIIYYLGRAIEKHLLKDGLASIAQAHLFSMIGLMDVRLQNLGYSKPELTKAMINLIRVGRLENELGPTGCYLTYKCVSTAVRSAERVSVAA